MLEIKNLSVSVGDRADEFPLSLMGEGKFLLAVGLEKLGEGVPQEISVLAHTLTRRTSCADLSHRGEVNQSITQEQTNA